MTELLLLLGIVGSALAFGLGDNSGSDDDNDVDNEETDDDELGEVQASTETLIVYGSGDEDLSWDEELEVLSEQDVFDVIEEEYDLIVEDRDGYEDFLDTEFEALQGTSEGETIDGTDEDDYAVGWEGDDTLILGDGDDSVEAVFANEAAGDDLIKGGDGDDTLTDGVGSDTIFGGLDDDELNTVDWQGEYAPDEIFGGDGDDILIGDQGDAMTGDEGDDLFAVVDVENSEGGPVTITDYDPEADHLEVYVETDDPKASDNYDVALNQVDGDVYVLVDGSEVAILNNVMVADVGKIWVGNVQRAG